jgi:hypothetical protein
LALKNTSRLPRKATTLVWKVKLGKPLPCDHLQADSVAELIRLRALNYWFQHYAHLSIFFITAEEKFVCAEADQVAEVGRE